MNQPKPLLIIMAKAPMPGLVKTRLRPFLSDNQSAELAGCFLVDTAAKALGAGVDTWIAYTPDDGRSAIADSLSEPYFYTKQEGDDLGERLSNVFAEGFSDGFGPIVAIGTDSPTMPNHHIDLAFDFLRSDPNGIVIGPTHDGGYYLIGMSRAQSGAFQNINWSSDRVYHQTLDKIRSESGLNLFELPMGFDVDTPDDLFRLFDEFAHDVGLQRRAPKTAQWLDSHRELFGRFTEHGLA